MNLTGTDIVNLLRSNDKAVARALIVLKDLQTADEQASESTRHLHGKGFRPCHARMGTIMAEYFQKKGKLTPKQAAYWRVRDKNGNMRIGIYANQLLSCIGEK